MNRASFRSSFRKGPQKSTISHIISRPQPPSNPVLQKHSFVVNSFSKNETTTSQTNVNGPADQSTRQIINLDTDQLIDSFIEKAANQPLHQCVELFLKEKFGVKNAIYWQEIPNAQILYSPSLRLVNEHSTGIVGNCYLQRQIQRIPTASAHPSFSSQMDMKISSQNSALLLFPLYDWRNGLTAICEVVAEGNNEFTIEDEVFAKWFQKKFKSLSRWLKHPLLMNYSPGNHQTGENNSARILIADDSPIHEIMQLTDLDSFVSTISKKMVAYFDCRAFEIWRYEKKTDKMYRFNELIESTESGIVGDSISRDQAINCISNRLSSSYNPKIDGETEESILSIPATEKDRSDSDNIVYGVVLRGSNHQLFTKDDEDALKKFLPYILLGYSNAQSFSNVNSAFQTSRIEQESLAALLEVVEVLSSQLDTNKVTDIILEKGRQLTNADRCSLFLLNEDKDTLSSYYQTGLKEPIVLSAQNGIAGKTIKEKKVFIIPDAYETDFFDSTTDKQTGYRTKSVLSVPIYSNRCEVIGVTEMMNKKPSEGSTNSGFTEWDSKVIQIFNIFCGISLENARLYNESLKQTQQLTKFFDTALTLSNTEDVHRLLSTILTNAKETVRADRASIFLVDEPGKALNSYIVDGEKVPNQIPLSTGLASLAAKNKKGILENDVYHCPDFNRAIDNATGYKTRSIIASPVFSSNGEIIGVVEMLNKKPDANNPTQSSGFDGKDLEILNSFATFASVALQKSRLKTIAALGDAEVEASNYMNEAERKSYQIPTKLVLTEQQRDTVRTLNCFAPDFKGIGHFKELFYFFSIWNLLETFKVTNEQFFRFIFTMRKQYTETSYHNWTHACDVSQYVTYQLMTAKADRYLTKEEIFIMLTAAICHDANHEGLNNVYNVKAETPLGILFKDQSVMEMHHITVAIPIILRNDINLFGAFDEQEGRKMWTLFIKLILATDMAHHFELVKKNQAIWDNNEWSWDNPEHRFLAMQLLIKVADISNVSRPFEYADKWCDILNVEFFRQGDLEKSTGIGLTSPLNDREHPDKPKSQIGFYNFICLPLYTTIARIFPELSVNAESVKSNLEVWKSMAAANEAKKKEEEAKKQQEEEAKKQQEEEKKPEETKKEEEKKD